MFFRMQKWKTGKFPVENQKFDVIAFLINPLYISVVLEKIKVNYF